MKRVTNSYKLLNQLSSGFLPLLSIAMILPVIVLSGFGVAALIEHGQWLLFLGLLACSCFIIFIPFWILRRKKVVESAVTADLHALAVEGNPQWGERDNQIWQAMNNLIDKQISEDCEWQALQAHAYVLVAEVADQYHQGGASPRLSFTAPEFLLMVEEVSRRYRHFLQDHVPFAEKITLKRLQQGYALKDKVGYAKSAYDAYRLLRITTPTGWLSEARGFVLGKLFEEVSLDVQTKLKKTLLQEVASVAIDLYSGHFKLEDASVPASKGREDDKRALAIAVEPLRIAVIGQVSAGKSSVINGLLGEISAEISALPSTDKATTYRCEVDDIDVIHLIDLPGIDGTPETNDKLLQQVVQSDVVLWVLKANQSSRQADLNLKQQIEAFYTEAKNQSRKAPKIIVVVNQVDKLKPVDEWLPPYDLTDIQTPKGQIIADAVAYNKTIMNSAAILPLSVSADRVSYNLDVLQQHIQAAYQEGINTQLNRRRMEGDKIDYGEQAKRLYRLGKIVFNAALK